MKPKAIAAFAALCLTFAHSAQAKETLSVFYPTTVPAPERQQALKNALKSSEVIVFGRFKDFSDQLKSQSPEVVIAPSSFAKYNKGYKVAAQLQSQGSSKFKYKLLGLEKVDPSKFPQKKVGVVEVADRTDLKDYVHSLLNKDVKLIKSVSKAEDLFPLLVFKSVDFIMISPQEYESLKEKFTTKFVQIGESSAEAAPAVFVKDGVAECETLARLKEVPADVLKQLGFSSIVFEGQGN